MSEQWVSKSLYQEVVTTLEATIAQQQARIEELKALAWPRWRGYAKHRQGCGYLVGNDCNCGLHALIDQARRPHHAGTGGVD